MDVQLLCNHNLPNMATPGVDVGTEVAETNLWGFLLFLLLISYSWETQSLYEFMGQSYQWMRMISGCDMVKPEDSRTAVTRMEVKNWHFNLQFQGTLQTQMWPTREPRQSTEHSS